MSSLKKNSVSANYETKNTSTFQLFHCQQTQSLLIMLYFIDLFSGLLLNTF
jgi:hypothetical protein